MRINLELSEKVKDRIQGWLPMDFIQYLVLERDSVVFNVVAQRHDEVIYGRPRSCVSSSLYST